MNWPSPQDFNEAIQTPAVSFADLDLANSEAVLGPTGLPLPQSGNFAQVYQLRESTGTEWAVKCFTRPAFGMQERYVQVSEALERLKLPFTVDFTFLPKGILVSGVWRPVVKMRWVAGLLLNHVVAENADRPQVLMSLTRLWVKLSRRLRDSGIAHADLQHGNVMLVLGSRAGVYELKLIDYDGMYVPALAGKPSGELGHAEYQHPSRKPASYSADLDRFPLLVVATALKALEASGTALWTRYDNGDNLLFTQQDFRDPASSKLMRELWTTGTPEVQALVGRLIAACGRPIEETPWLDEIAPDGEPIPLDAEATREVEAAFRQTALGEKTPRLPSKPTIPTAADTRPAKPYAAKPAKPSSTTRPPGPVPPLLVPPSQPPQTRIATSTGRPQRPSGKRSRSKKNKSGRLPLAIAGGLAVVLLVGLGVLLNRTKSRDGGQRKADDAIEEVIVPKGEIEKPPPKDPVSPKPKDPILPKPKDPILPKPKDPEPKPKDPPPPVEPMLLNRRWTTTVETEGAPAQLHADLDAQVILVGSERTSLLSVDFATGAKRAGFLWFGLTGGNSFCPMERSRVAKCLTDDTEVMSWDVKTGKTGDKYAVPEIAAGTGKATHKFVHLSPDGRYIVVARAGLVSGVYPEVPFLVFDTKTGKPLLTIDWTCGSTHFTADASRILVAEFKGRFRWFKLPSGDPDGDWEYRATSDDQFHTVTDISDDGRVIGYTGPGKKASEAGPCLLDGKTGEVLHRFGDEYHEKTPVVVSAGGRHAAVLRRFDGDDTTIDVVTVPKGEVIARASFVTSQSLPTFTLSRHSETLLVHDRKSGRLIRYDLPRTN